MKLSAVAATLAAAYESSKQPFMLWGPPGVGKSSIVKQAAESLAVECIDLRLSLLEPIDLRGFPVPDMKAGSMTWVRDFAINPAKGKGILLLDEIPQASPSMQAAASQLILDRRVGPHKLGDGWMVAAAGNRKSDRASVNAMPTHIANRFVHINVEVSTDEWIAWAVTHGIDMRVIAYIKWRPSMLHHFDSQSKSEAFASPRSWEFASRLLDSGLKNGTLLELMKGTIGEAAGTEFTGFLAVFDKMPSIDTILLNPMQAALPGDPATLYALSTALVHRADKDNLGKIARYFDRLKDAQRPEFAALALKEVSLKKPELAKTRAYVEWASSMAPVIA